MIKFVVARETRLWKFSVNTWNGIINFTLCTFLVWIAEVALVMYGSFVLNCELRQMGCALHIWQSDTYMSGERIWDTTSNDHSARLYYTFYNKHQFIWRRICILWRQYVGAFCIKFCINYYVIQINFIYEKFYCLNRELHWIFIEMKIGNWI